MPRDAPPDINLRDLVAMLKDAHGTIASGIAYLEADDRTRHIRQINAMQEDAVVQRNWFKRMGIKL